MVDVVLLFGVGEDLKFFACILPAELLVLFSANCNEPPHLPYFGECADACQKSSFPHGTVYQVKCLDGFHSQSSKETEVSLKCDDSVWKYKNGNWSQAAFKCHGGLFYFRVR